MKRYIIAVTGLNRDDERKLIEFAKNNDLHWWHWIGDLWLLNDPSGSFDAQKIRDFLLDLDSSKRCIVFENPEHSKWAGFGPSKTEMFAWVKKNWKRKLE